jgi:hypothetical protein
VPLECSKASGWCTGESGDMTQESGGGGGGGGGLGFG